MTSNLTLHIQPLDARIIRAFKSYYHRLYIFCALALDEVNSSNINIYEIEQLEAMHLARQAWNSVTKTTIQNCWQHAQILPLQETPSNHTTYEDIATIELQEALQELSCSGFVSS